MGQICRGQQILQMLSESPTSSIDNNSNATDTMTPESPKRNTSYITSPEVRITVKHTFIQLVDPMSNVTRHRRSRAFTDSQLFDSWSEDCDWTLSELSDASTEEPVELHEDISDDTCAVPLTLPGTPHLMSETMVCMPQPE